MNTPLSTALAEMRRQFASQLGARVATIREQFDRIDPAHWQTEAAEELHRMVHGLTGSAGTFGMNSVSDCARALEQQLAALTKAATPPTVELWAVTEAALVRLERLSKVRLESDAPSLMPAPSRKILQGSPPLIHLVEDNAEQARAVSQALISNGFPVHVFNTIADFHAACASGETPAAVVMDMIFANDGMAGAHAIRQLLANQKDMPPVVFLSVRDDIEARLAAYRAGAARYFTKPVDIAKLGRVLDELTGRMPPQAWRVLLVDDDPLLLEAHAAVLRQSGMEVRTISEPLLALDAVRDFKPDVLVLDVYMPDATGPELAAILREQEVFAHMPILFLSAETDMGRQLTALGLGGDDFLVKPVEPAHLVAAVGARARRARQNGEMMRQLQEVIYEREREHLALNQHAIVSITDRAGTITYVNEKFTEVSGYTVEEVLGRNHRIVKSGLHAPEFYADIWRTIAAGRIWNGEICNRKKNGELYWVASTITPFLDTEGKPYQYVAIRTDITVQKVREEELRLGEERLSLAVEGAGDGVWDWDMRSNAMHFSRLYMVMLGYEENELPHHVDTWVDSVHPEDLARVKARLDDYLSGRLPDYVVELRLHCKDGGWKWVLCRGKVVGRDDAGNPVRMIGIHTDITRRKADEAALMEAREAAESANRAKSDFLSSMSHELRTPMNAILGFGQLLDFDDTLSADHKDQVQEILKAGHHLLGLINEVLDLAKIESGRVDLSLETVAMTELVDECVSLVRPLAQERQITMHIENTAGKAVRADRARLRQVLLNLLSNAVKYNRPAGKITLAMEAAAPGMTRISVTDTGEGIPPERMGELFQPFNRLAAEGSAIEGTGIGLVITRRLANLMGGAVGAQSTPGIGSTFWVVLPEEKAEEASSASTAADSNTRNTDQSEAQEKQVLYIEDNPANLRLVAQIFGKYPHIRLLTAHAPELGIDLIKAHRPDLILLDINMPGMNGYEVLDIIKADASLRDTPVMAISANAMPGDVERGKAAGFVEYLTKPLDVDLFVKAVDRWLD